jgi:Helix-hairpin-helix motif
VVRAPFQLLLCLPFGVTTWAAFLYIGIRARRPRWLVWAGLYAGMFAGFAALENPAHPSETAKSVALGLLLAAWIGGGTHAIAVSGNAIRRIHRGHDPAMEAAQDRIDRRAEGRHLLASRPALAREIGVGRPDLPGASDYGLVDVNHASAAALARLPGITQQLADRIVGQRAQVGGFTSAEDLGVLLDLSTGHRRRAARHGDLPVRLTRSRSAGDLLVGSRHLTGGHPSGSLDILRITYYVIRSPDTYVRSAGKRDNRCPRWFGNAVVAAQA